MKQVNIYTYSTAKSPKAAKSQCEAVGFVIEYQDKKDKAYPQMKIIKEMSTYQSELYVLERALSRITTMCEVHCYIECEYVAAGFEQGWLDEWMRNGWKNKSNKEVGNKEEWQALIALVQKYDHYMVFHVKENHAYSEWLKRNMEKEKARCLKSLESSTQQKR